VNADRGQGAQDRESGRAVLRPPPAAQHRDQAQDQSSQPGGDQQRAGQAGGRQQLERSAVGVPPGAVQARRLLQGEGIAEGAQTGAGDREALPQRQRRRPGLPASSQADVERHGGQHPCGSCLQAHGERRRDPGNDGCRAQHRRRPAALHGGQQRALDDDPDQRGHQAAARSREGEPGEEGQPDESRWSERQHPLVQSELGASAARRPPSPGEDQGQRDLQVHGEVVGVEEGAAQPRGGDRHLHAPQGALAGIGIAGAKEDLDERGCHDRPGQPPAAVAPQAGGGAGQQAGRRGDPGESGAVGRGRREAQARRAGSRRSQQLRSLFVQARVLR
jgi:hypothetical protein